METKKCIVQKTSNASCVYIPEEAVRALGLVKGGLVNVDLENNNTIVISNEKKIPNSNDAVINYLIHQGLFNTEKEVITRALERLLHDINMNGGVLKTDEQIFYENHNQTLEMLKRMKAEAKSELN